MEGGLEVGSRVETFLVDIYGDFEVDGVWSKEGRSLESTEWLFFSSSTLLPDGFSCWNNQLLHCFYFVTISTKLHLGSAWLMLVPQYRKRLVIPVSIHAHVSVLSHVFNIIKLTKFTGSTPSLGALSIETRCFSGTF